MVEMLHYSIMLNKYLVNTQLRDTVWNLPWSIKQKHPVLAIHEKNALTVSDK